jgi:hypothetical protein
MVRAVLSPCRGEEGESRGGLDRGGEGRGKKMRGK